MKKLLKYILINTFALITHNYSFNNLIFTSQTLTIIKVAIVLSIFEIILKPIIKIILLPINILTLGTFRIIINTLGLYLATFLIEDFRVQTLIVPEITFQNLHLGSLQLPGFLAFIATSLTISIIFHFYKFILSKNK